MSFRNPGSWRRYRLSTPNQRLCLFSRRTETMPLKRALRKKAFLRNRAWHSPLFMALSSCSHLNRFSSKKTQTINLYIFRSIHRLFLFSDPHWHLTTFIALYERDAFRSVFLLVLFLRVVDIVVVALLACKRNLRSVHKTQSRSQHAQLNSSGSLNVLLLDESSSLRNRKKN